MKRKFLPFFLVVRNAEKTSNQRPWGSETYADLSWIDYWCAFANSDESGCIPEPVRKPSTCSADSHERKYLDSNNTSQENSDHNEEIVGVHVIIECDPQKDLGDVEFIAPLCDKCNGKHGEIVNVQLGTRLVEMLGPTNEEDEIILQFEFFHLSNFKSGETRNLYYCGTTNYVEREKRKYNVSSSFRGVKCSSPRVATNVIQRLHNLGYNTRGQLGNGAEDSVYVYIYKMGPDTKP